MVLSIVLPSTAQVYANTDTYKSDVLESMGLTQQDINDLNIISKYMKYDKDKRVYLYDIDKAKESGVEDRLIKESEGYNKTLLEYADSLPEDEQQEKRGSTYFKIKGGNNFEIGLSSTVCKKIINIAKNGAKAVAGFLIGLFPPIAPFVGPIANLFINKIAKELKKYTSTGVVLRIQKMSGEWHVWYYKQ